MQKRTPEYLKKAIESLREGNQRQAKIIKEKNKKIKELIEENLSISYELRVLKNKYQELYYDLFKQNK